MIDRYNSPQISEIWSKSAKFKTYLKVELALMEALEGSLIPKGVSEAYKNKVKIDPSRIEELEKISKHDVIAFCSSVTEQVPTEHGKYFHFGCTSSDIIDTATNLQIKESCFLISNKLKKVLETLKQKAIQTKNLVCLGRSHGQNAEPMSFSLKFLSAYCELERASKDLEEYHDSITGMFSGAVGNYTILSTEIEAKVCESLELKVETVSTQIIPRDRLVRLIQITTLIANAIESLSVEIRLLSHSDIREVHEGFSEKQKGSSTMPHKRNPVSTENLTGICRVIRSHISVANENNCLWHERDISHSSAERMILPDNLGLTFYALNRLESTLEHLVINESIIESKVLSCSSFLSSYVLHKVIAETDLSREEAYPLVQEISFKAESLEDFLALMRQQKEFKAVNFLALERVDLQTIRSIYLKDIDKVFERVFN